MHEWSSVTNKAWLSDQDVVGGAYKLLYIVSLEMHGVSLWHNLSKFLAKGAWHGRGVPPLVKQQIGIRASRLVYKTLV